MMSLNRHDVSVPLGGDQARPLELITGGFYSRRQIDRELSYYIHIGTPALVHNNKAKGSTLGPKSQWGVAVGMHQRESYIYFKHLIVIKHLAPRIFLYEYIIFSHLSIWLPDSSCACAAGRPCEYHLIEPACSYI